MNLFRPFLLFLFFLPIFLTETPTPSPPPPPPPLHGLNIWPQPRNVSWPLPIAIRVSPSLSILSPNHTHLSRAAHRYRRLLLTERHRPLLRPAVDLTSAAVLRRVKITVRRLSAPLRNGVDESYSLRIDSDGGDGEITAATAWGAMRGLETLSQVVWEEEGEGLVAAAGIRVWDEPVTEHRGLMLDTSRNFYSVEDIVRTMKGMSYNKMNLFHWHITDSQAFPLEIRSRMEMAEKGSYGVGMRYSCSDVERIVEVGFELGVRVLPEIDMPGHTGSWTEAYPDIVTCAHMFWWPDGVDWADRLASEPGTGQLNPLNPNTYTVVKDIIRDVANLFPEPFFHSGGDEVVPGCWKTHPDVTEFLSKGAGSLSDLLETFVNSTLPYITSFDRTVIYWEDILLDDTIAVPPTSLPRDRVILQTWKGGPQTTKRIVELGYRVIVSSSDFYYLDCGHGNFVQNKNKNKNKNNIKNVSWCDPFKAWDTIYEYDIREGIDGETRGLVVGGEVVLWSEQTDGTVMDGRIWPRASAMAEALWSGNKDEKGMKRYAVEAVEAVDRLNEWRYRMVRRGLKAEPIQPLWCVRNTGMCNL